MPQFGTIYEAMLGFFTSDDWNFNAMDDLPVLSMPFTGKNGKWMCYAQAREKQEQFVFYSVFPVNAPAERQAAVVEFITRANYGMIIGNFEFDYNDGEIRYKTSIDVEGAELTEALVRHMVYANVIILDRYLPGMMRVIYAEADPQAEIDKIEGSKSDADDQDDGIDEQPLSQGIIDDIEKILTGLDTGEVTAAPPDDATLEDPPDAADAAEEADAGDGGDDDGGSDSDDNPPTDGLLPGDDAVPF